MAAAARRPCSASTHPHIQCPAVATGWSSRVDKRSLHTNKHDTPHRHAVAGSLRRGSWRPSPGRRLLCCCPAWPLQESQDHTLHQAQDQAHQENEQQQRQQDQMHQNPHAAQAQPGVLLGIAGLLQPVDCHAVSNIIKHRVMELMLAAQDALDGCDAAAAARAAEEAVEACEQELAQLLPALDIIKVHHPDSNWRDAAAAAHLHLDDVQSEVRSLRRQHAQHACTSSGRDDTSSKQGEHLSSNQPPTNGPDLLYLRGVEHALVSAVTAVLHDERRAPRLPVTAQHVEQNPPLAALLSALAGSSGSTADNFPESSSIGSSSGHLVGQQVLHCSTTPDEPLLYVCDGIAVDLAEQYCLNEQNAHSGHQNMVAHETDNGDQGSCGGASSSSDGSSSVVCRLALTASTCTSLLSAPALLSAPTSAGEQTLQQQVYQLGVLQRTAVVQQLLDMLRATHEDIAAAMGASNWGAVALAGSAAGHPMAVTSLLRQLAGACRPAAMQEAAEWLQASGLADGLRPDSTHLLEPWDVESLRQLSAERAAAGMSAGSSGRGSSTWQRASCDYLGVNQVLEGACELLGGCFGLHMACSTPAQGEAWGESAWRLDIEDAAGTGQLPPGRLMGSCYVLVDEQHQGLPFTAMVRHGRCSPAGNNPSTVCIMLPADFLHPGPANPPLDTPTGSAAPSAQPILALDRLVTLLHELGHALHFLLSSAVRVRLRDGGCWAHTELAELPSHLMERFARDPRCLQVLLRHRTTGRPPPPLLCKQITAYMRCALKGPYVFQEHLCAALMDQLLCALPSDPAADGYFGTAEIMAEVTREYSGLPQVPVGVRMLQWLPGMAQLAGCMYSYPVAELVAAAVWAKHLADPLDSNMAVRRLLLEQGANISLEEVVQGLLGHGSMEAVWPQKNATGTGSDEPSGVVQQDLLGFVPCLEHPAYQDIDLWG